MVYKCEMDVHYTGYCAAMSEIIYSKPLHHSFHTSPAIKIHQDSWVTGLHDIPSSASAWFLLGSNNFPHAECGPCYQIYKVQGVIHHIVCGYIGQLLYTPICSPVVRLHD